MMLWELVSITCLTLNIRQFITLQLPTDWEIIEINPIKNFRMLKQSGLISRPEMNHLSILTKWTEIPNQIELIQ